MMRKVVVNPSSTEVNRGSYCYDPYLYAALHDCRIIEDASVEKMLHLDFDAEKWIVGLWSYPQIDFARWAVANLRRVSFVGYKPLIRYLGYEVEEFDVTNALCAYPYQYDRFDNVLLSDCDLHLKSDGDNTQVYPLFLGYGCPNSCSFCSTSVNCERHVYRVSPDKASELVSYVSSLGHIHFTDESFFIKPPNYLDRVYDSFPRHNRKWIALTSANDFLREVKRVGIERLKDTGLSLIEVGYEAFDISIRYDMGKKDSIHNLYELIGLDIPVLWLTVTFYPRDTIASIRQTGAFLKRHGFDPKELEQRVATNSTQGGLGQFFQPYTGTHVELDGVMIVDRPVRLAPSFLPNSFLDEIPEVVDIDEDKVRWWTDLYNIPGFTINLIDGRSIREIIAPDPARMAIYLAILARLGYIESCGKKRTEPKFKTYRWEY